MGLGGGVSRGGNPLLGYIVGESPPWYQWGRDTCGSPLQLSRWDGGGCGLFRRITTVRWMRVFWRRNFAIFGDRFGGASRIMGVSVGLLAGGHVAVLWLLGGDSVCGARADKWRRQTHLWLGCSRQPCRQFRLFTPNSNDLCTLLLLLTVLGHRKKTSFFFLS